MLKGYMFTIELTFHIQVNKYTDTFDVIADTCPPPLEKTTSICVDSTSIHTSFGFNLNGVYLLVLLTTYEN